jgi:hypothetical protein
MYSFREYWNTPKERELRWNPSDNSFSRPEYSIAKPLEQCQFVMTRLDSNKKPFPVDIWGSSVDPKIYGTTDFFNNARPLWVDGQGSFYDGYSIELSTNPTPVLVGGIKYYVVGGVYEDCVSWLGEDGTISSEFIADRIALNDPLMWFTPNRKGMCWAGLSATPIVGGTSNSKKISSFDLSIPITTFFLRDGVVAGSDEDVDYLSPLPKNADQIINNWFAKKKAA